MLDAQIEKSRSAAALTGVGVTVVAFIAVALLSVQKPLHWLVPAVLLGAAYYFRAKAHAGLWGFSTRRTSNIGWWAGGFAAFFALAESTAPPADNPSAEPVSVAANPIEDAAEKAKAEEKAAREAMRDAPENYVELQNVQWSKEFSVMEISVTIKNNSKFALKDFVVDCEHSGPSGTVMDSNRREIFEIVEAGKSKRITDFNMGFINSQAASTACIVKDAKIVE